MASSSPHQPDGVTGARSRRDRARLVAVGILAVVAGLFALFNLDETRVNLIFGTVTMPLIIVIVACVLIGVAIGMFLSRRRGREHRG